jgi:hypothetical protein
MYQADVARLLEASHDVAASDYAAGSAKLDGLSPLLLADADRLRATGEEGLATAVATLAGDVGPFNQAVDEADRVPTLPNLEVVLAATTLIRDDVSHIEINSVRREQDRTLSRKQLRLRGALDHPSTPSVEGHLEGWVTVRVVG